MVLVLRVFEGISGTVHTVGELKAATAKASLVAETPWWDGFPGSRVVS